MLNVKYDNHRLGASHDLGGGSDPVLRRTRLGRQETDANA